MRWYWASWFPFWLCWYATVDDKGFSHFFPSIRFDWSALSALLSDFKNLAFIVMGFIAALFLFIYRQQVYLMLGIDDRFVLHWANWFSFHSGESNSVLQICIWQVTDQYQCFTGHDLEKTKDQEQRDKDAGEAVQSGGSLFGSCGRGGRNAGRHNARPKMDIKHNCSMYVRVAYGHNEPLHGRVVHAEHGFEVIDFCEVFRVNKDDSALETEMASLYIEVMKQELVGRQDLGRVEIQPNRLRRWLDANDVLEPDSGADGKQMIGLAKAQLLAMMEEEYSVENTSNTRLLSTFKDGDGLDEKRRIMAEKYGFKELQLSQGGSVWVAIAKVEQTSRK